MSLSTAAGALFGLLLIGAEPATPAQPSGTLERAAAAEAAPAKAKRRAAPPETFERGLSAYYADDFSGAAAAMFDYVSTNEDTVVNYAWAEYFLGVSLARLDFSQAAAEYLYNAVKIRTRPEILPEALIELEKITLGAHDERLIDAKILTDSDLGYLPKDVADFVRFHQGLADLRADRVAWAKTSFDAINDESAYKARAIYSLGVERLKKRKTPDAVRYFRLALVHPTAERETRNEARLALARVLYEGERYPAARRIYDQVEVPELTTAEASLFLERAWTSYWLRDYRKAMGILYALEAPSYRDFLAPDKFLLRALIYKNLCHYIPAKREIRRFRFKLGTTLDNIKARIDLREDEVLRTAALNRGPLGRLAAFRRRLADEADRIDTVGGDWVEVGLDEQLRRIYRLRAEYVDLHLEAELRVATREIAEELVEFEEQMYLLDYEVGLAIYRRLKREDARRPTEADNLKIPSGGEAAYYAFDGEFWNDELPAYDFFVENRCFDEGGDD